MSATFTWLRHQSMLLLGTASFLAVWAFVVVSPQFHPLTEAEEQLLGTWRSAAGLTEMTFSRDHSYSKDSLTDGRAPVRGRWNVSHETVRLIEADGQVYDLDLKFEGPNRLLARGPKSKVRWERDPISRFTDPQ